MSSLDQKYIEMTTTPVRRLVLRLAIPTIISMMVTSLYNVVDAAFVGSLSTEATAAIGVGFAYQTFIQAVGFFFGHGSGNHISRALGARKQKDAALFAAVGFFSPLIIGTITAILGLLTLPTLCTLLGATPDVVEPTCDYLRYILIASPFMMSALTLNNQLRLQGNARLGMIGLVSGAVLNVVLDPILIFGCGMGVSGASLATAISQFCCWCLLLWGTFRPSSVHISIRYFRPSWTAFKEITAGGLPSLCRQACNCMAAILLNHAAARYATPGYEASCIGAFAVVSRTMMLVFSFVLGFCQGFQPVCGYNYGARLYKRVSRAFTFTLSAGTLILLVISSMGFIFAEDIVRIFRDEDPELIRIGAHALRWQCLAFPTVGIPTATNMLFQNIRMPIRSTLISIGRQGLFFVPTILILPHFMGLQGVEMTQAIADVLTCLFSIPFAIWIYRRLNQLAKTEKGETACAASPSKASDRVL